MILTATTSLDSPENLKEWRLRHFNETIGKGGNAETHLADYLGWLKQEIVYCNQQISCLYPNGKKIFNTESGRKEKHIRLYTKYRELIEKEIPIVKNKYYSDPEEKIVGFEKCIEECQYLLPFLIAEYNDKKPKEKALMVLALIQLECIKEPHITSVTNTHRLLKMSFEGVGSDSNFAKHLSTLKGSAHSHDIALINKHIKTIQTMLSKK